MLLRKIVDSLKKSSISNLKDEDHKEDERNKCAETYDCADREVFLKHLANILSSLERGSIK